MESNLLAHFIGIIVTFVALTILYIFISILFKSIILKVEKEEFKNIILKVKKEEFKNIIDNVLKGNFIDDFKQMVKEFEEFEEVAIDLGKIILLTLPLFICFYLLKSPDINSLLSDTIISFGIKLPFDIALLCDIALLVIILLVLCLTNFDQPLKLSCSVYLLFLLLIYQNYFDSQIILAYSFLVTGRFFSFDTTKESLKNDVLLIIYKLPDLLFLMIMAYLSLPAVDKLVLILKNYLDSCGLELSEKNIKVVTFCVFQALELWGLKILLQKIVPGFRECYTNTESR